MIYNVKIGKNEIEIDDEILELDATITNKGVTTYLYNDTQDEMIIVTNDKNEVIDAIFWGNGFDAYIYELLSNKENTIICESVRFYNFVEIEIEEREINHCSYELSEELESEYLKGIALDYMMKGRK